ncbi:MAG: hypothetical protein ACRD4B_00155, partial [Acidobacteriota bacterium]
AQTGTLYGVGSAWDKGPIKTDSTYWGFYISHDLGRTFTRYQGRPHNPASETPDFYQLNPFDTNDIFLRLQGAGWPGAGTYYFTRSKDGGKTWQGIPEFPDAWDGSGDDLLLTIDVRTPGLFYCTVIGVYHGFTRTNHRSTDHGYTWEMIDYWDEFAGIGEEGELRSIDEGRGFWIFSTEAGEGRYNDWVSTALTTTKTGEAKGYKVEMGDWIFNPHDPRTSFINIYESQRDTADVIPDNGYLYDRVYAFRTTNDGETFELLSDPEKGSVYIVGFDPTTNTLYGQLYGMRDLLKRTFAKSTVDLASPAGTAAHISVFPNPCRERTAIRYTLDHTSS